jgi:V-type H+-transporting ATPase proteolipid subunit
VGIRLANTLFVNGIHRTMFASRWVADPATSNIVLEHQSDLTSCSISSVSGSLSSSLQAPLHPVTQRRKVISSMGNILRQVAKDDGADKPIPASSELEKELPLYVRENNLMNQRLAVWALVEPSSGESSPNKRPPKPITDIDNSTSASVGIRNGARLHRVVSGGGGWGKKQGLLSLDIGLKYKSHISPRNASSINQIFKAAMASDRLTEGNDASSDEFPAFGHFGDGDGGEITSLSQVAEYGDHIQFFVAQERSTEPSNPINSSPSSCENGDVYSGQAHPTTFTFGVISGPDDPALPSSPRSSEAASAALLTIPNHFGALSEKGIAYASFLHTAEAANPGDDGSGIAAQCSETLITVPGSRFEMSIGRE